MDWFVTVGHGLWVSFLSHISRSKRFGGTISVTWGGTSYETTVKDGTLLVVVGERLRYDTKSDAQEVCYRRVL